jgi:hypothetical protein
MISIFRLGAGGVSRQLPPVYFFNFDDFHLQAGGRRRFSPAAASLLFYFEIF